MGIPLHQGIRVEAYLVKQKMAGNEKFPLSLELEPPFACNLAPGQWRISMSTLPPISMQSLVLMMTVDQGKAVNAFDISGPTP